MGNFEAYKLFCEENDLDLTSVESRRRFEAATGSKSESKRKHTRKEVEILCFVHGSRGSELFKQATVPNIASVKKHNAWVLSMEAQNQGLDFDRCVVVAEEIELD